MRQWERVTHAMMCGGCGQLLGEGMAMQTITIATMKRQLIRCENCAGDAPPDLPASPLKHQTTKTMKPIASLAAKAKSEWMPYREP